MMNHRVFIVLCLVLVQWCTIFSDAHAVPIRTKMRANWEKTSLISQTCESLRSMTELDSRNDPFFLCEASAWGHLERFVESTLSISEQQEYEIAKEVINEVTQIMTGKNQTSFYDMALLNLKSWRHSGLILSHAQMFTEYDGFSISDCPLGFLGNSKGKQIRVCGLKKILQTLSDDLFIKGTLQVLPKQILMPGERYLYHTRKTDNVYGIFYGTIGRKDTHVVLDRLRKYIKQHDVSFIFRHHPSTLRNAEPFYLQGYGVTLTMKNSDYIVTDIDTHGASELEGTDLSYSVFKGVDTVLLHRELKKNNASSEIHKLLKTEDTMVTSVQSQGQGSTTVPLERDLTKGYYFDIFSIGPQMVTYLLSTHNGTEFNKFKHAVDYSQNIPMLVPQLTNTSVTPDVIRSLSYLRSVLKIPNGYNELSIRGSTGSLSQSTVAQSQMSLVDTAVKYIGVHIANERKINDVSQINLKRRKPLVVSIPTIVGGESLAVIPPFTQSIHQLLDLLNSNVYVQNKIENMFSNSPPSIVRSFISSMDRCVASNALHLKSSADGGFSVTESTLKGRSTDESELRYNLDPQNIFWLNDINIDETYTHLSPEFMSFIDSQSAIKRAQNEPVFIRKNIYNIVMLIDVKSLIHVGHEKREQTFAILNGLFSLLSNNVPFRLGCLFTNSDETREDNLMNPGNIMEASLFQLNTVFRQAFSLLLNPSVDQESHSLAQSLQSLRRLRLETILFLVNTLPDLITDASIEIPFNALETVNQELRAKVEHIKTTVAEVLGMEPSEVSIDIRPVQETILDSEYKQYSQNIRELIFSDFAFDGKKDLPGMFLNGIKVIDGQLIEQEGGKNFDFNTALSHLGQVLKQEDDRLVSWIKEGFSSDEKKEELLQEEINDIYLWILKKGKAKQYINMRMVTVEPINASSSSLNTYVALSNDIASFLDGKEKHTLASLCQDRECLQKPMTQIIILSGARLGILLKKTILSPTPTPRFSMKLLFSKELQVLSTVVQYYKDTTKKNSRLFVDIEGDNLKGGVSVLNSILHENSSSGLTPKMRLHVLSQILDEIKNLVHKLTEQSTSLQFTTDEEFMSWIGSVLPDYKYMKYFSYDPNSKMLIFNKEFVYDFLPADVVTEFSANIKSTFRNLKSIRAMVYDQVEQLHEATLTMSDIVNMFNKEDLDTKAWRSYTGPLLLTNGRVLSLSQDDRFVLEDNRILLDFEEKDAQRFFTCLYGRHNRDMEEKNDNDSLIYERTLFDNKFVDLYQLYGHPNDGNLRDRLSSKEIHSLAQKTFLPLFSTIRALELHIKSPQLKEINANPFSLGTLTSLSLPFFRDLEDNGKIDQEQDQNHDTTKINFSAEVRELSRRLQKHIRRGNSPFLPNYNNSSSLKAEEVRAYSLSFKQLASHVGDLLYQKTRPSLRDVHQSLVIQLKKENHTILDGNDETLPPSQQYIRAVVDPTTQEGQRILSLVNVLFDSLPSVTVTILLNPPTSTKVDASPSLGGSEPSPFSGGLAIHSLVRKEQRKIVVALIEHILGLSESYWENRIVDGSLDLIHEWVDAFYLGSRTILKRIDTLFLRELKEAADIFKQYPIAPTSVKHSISVNPNAHGKMPLSFYRYVFDTELKFSPKDGSLLPPSVVFEGLPSKVVTKGIDLSKVKHVINKGEKNLITTEDLAPFAKSLIYTLGTDELEAWMVFLDSIEQKKITLGDNTEKKTRSPNAVPLHDADNLILNLGEMNASSSSFHYSSIDVEYGLRHILLTGTSKSLTYDKQKSTTSVAPPQSLPLVLLPPRIFDDALSMSEKKRYRPYADTILMAHNFGYFQLRVPSLPSSALLGKKSKDSSLSALSGGGDNLTSHGFGLYLLDIHLFVHNFYKKYIVRGVETQRYGDVFHKSSSSLLLEATLSKTDFFSSFCENDVSTENENNNLFLEKESRHREKQLVMVTSLTGHFVHLSVAEVPSKSEKALQLNEEDSYEEEKVASQNNNVEKKKLSLLSYWTDRINLYRNRFVRESSSSHLSSSVSKGSETIKSTSDGEKKESQNEEQIRPTLNVFSLASGLLYERLMRLMMLGVTTSSNKTLDDPLSFESLPKCQNKTYSCVYNTVETLTNNDELTLADFLEMEIPVGNGESYDIYDEVTSTLDSNQKNGVIRMNRICKEMTRLKSWVNGFHQQIHLPNRNGNGKHLGLSCLKGVCPIGAENLRSNPANVASSTTSSVTIQDSSELLREVRLSHHLRKQLVSIPKQKRIKFWVVENFLSPHFKKKIDRFAREVLNADIELVSYKWPYFLRKQADKQRFIWAYKVLFLDVLFPLDLERVIFVDADQVVSSENVFELTRSGESHRTNETVASRGTTFDIGISSSSSHPSDEKHFFQYRPLTDLHELYNLDIENKAIAFTPFCGSRHNYFQSHLEHSMDKKSRMEREEKDRKNMPLWQKEEFLYDRIGNVSQKFHSVGELFSDYLDAYDITKNNNMNNETAQFAFWNAASGTWVGQLQRKPLLLHRLTRIAPFVETLFNGLWQIKNKYKENKHNNSFFFNDISCLNVDQLRSAYALAFQNAIKQIQQPDAASLLNGVLFSLQKKYPWLSRHEVLRRFLYEVRRLERNYARFSNIILTNCDINSDVGCRQSRATAYTLNNGKYYKRIGTLLRSLHTLISLKKDYYHISALFLVDFAQFRYAYNGGDVYRFYYQQLSEDPRSLSNLDQDLPNFVQRINGDTLKLRNEIQNGKIFEERVFATSELVVQLLQLIDVKYVLLGKKQSGHESYYSLNQNKQRKDKELIRKARKTVVRLGEFVPVVDARKSVLLSRMTEGTSGPSEGEEGSDIFSSITNGIPIFSLPETFLYCSTWCSKKLRPYIKTVDLCNNPLTKSTKIENANFVINNWDTIDKLVRDRWARL